MRSDTNNTKELHWLQQEKYGGTTPPAFFDDKKRLESGEPLDYIIGSKPFLGCTIDLTFRPLIPRTETENWVEKVLATLPRSPIHILDIFAGSGCVGVALARHLPNARVDFADNDLNCLKQIRKNIALHNLTPRAQVMQSNVFSNITCRYDYIFANPPYIARNSTGVQDSVLNHEPHAALFARNNGFNLIQKTIQGAHEHLKPNGTLFIEHDPHQTQQIHNLAHTLPYKRIHTHKDQYEYERMTEVVYNPSCIIF